MSLPLFPPLKRENVLACQLSVWYPIFSSLSIRTVTIRPLDKRFREYLLADGIYVPMGSENALPHSELSDEEADEEEPPTRYSFAELDAQIRQVIKDFGAVFPKLNWSSPKDAAWILPQSSPLRCTSPADVYLLLKSSDFVNHDLDAASVFEGCEHSEDGGDANTYELELSLRKWYPIDRSREFRCFVREDTLIAACQRDPNYYEYLNSSETQASIMKAINQLWRENLKGKCPAGSHYVFDALLTRDLSRAHLIDINPYAPRTDSLLFTYETLLDIAQMAPTIPKLAVIDSVSHADAARNAPTYQHNMVPLEALHLSAGRTPQEFSEALADEVARMASES